MNCWYPMLAKGVMIQVGAVKLKIKEPIIHSYGHQCAIYSILSAYPEIEPRLYCNYTQIFTLRNLHTAVKLAKVYEYTD